MESISVLTYNLDAKNIDYKERLNIFFSQVDKLSPDIIAIQEGHQLIYERIFREFHQKKYYKQFPEEMRTRSTGEVLFSRFPIVSSEYIPFQHTKKNRGITKYIIEVENQKLCVCTSQLEESFPTRRKQLLQLEICLGRENMTTIFLGDTQNTNFQQLECPNDWCDVWYEVGTADTQYTIDYQKNLSVQPPIRDRPDRVWFRNKSILSISCSHLSLVGTDDEAKASRHFGVYVKFKWEEEHPPQV